MFCWGLPESLSGGWQRNSNSLRNANVMDTEKYTLKPFAYFVRYNIVPWCIDLLDYILLRNERLCFCLSRGKRVNEGLQLHKEWQGFLLKLIEPLKAHNSDISIELMQKLCLAAIEYRSCGFFGENGFSLGICTRYFVKRKCYSMKAVINTWLRTREQLDIDWNKLTEFINYILKYVM